MSSIKRTARNLSLLSHTSLAALCLVGAGGVSMVPSSAMAANECGDPNANGATADTFTCTGTFPAIIYPDTEGPLTLRLQNNVTVTSGGLIVTMDPASADAININRIDSPANSGDPSLTNTSGAALQVTRATAGTINVNLADPTNDYTDTSMTFSGTTYGVRLVNAGGANTFTAVDGTISASSGTAIFSSTTGTGTHNLTLGRFQTGGAADPPLLTITGATNAVELSGGILASISVPLNTIINGHLIINNVSNVSAQMYGELNGRIVVMGTGPVNYHNVGVWRFTGTSHLGDGNSTLQNFIIGDSGVNDYRIETNFNGAATTLDFGAGTDAWNNRTLAVGTGSEAASTLVVANLESWNNSSDVFFGTRADLQGSDGVPNDRITVTSPLTFTGSQANGGGFGWNTFWMDVDFGGAAQTNCLAAVSADCMDLRGSTTAGQTYVVVNTVGIGVSPTPIVLVDVTGAGTSADSHFLLDERSTGFIASGEEGALDTGVFVYRLGYDADLKQHALTPVAPGSGMTGLSHVGGAVRDVWETTTGSWYDRQADLRHTVAFSGAGSRPGAWLKLASNHTDRTSLQSHRVSGTELDFITSFGQDTKAVVGGVDLLNVSSGDQAWVAGVTAGRVTSEVAFTHVSGEIDMEGYSFGAYASAVLGALFVDGIVNANKLDLEYDTLGATGVASEVDTLGWQLETGWRLNISDVFYLEPLAALAYVKTEIGGFELSDHVIVDFDEISSLRGALGGRWGGALDFNDFDISLAFTGRVWNEFEGDNAVSVEGIPGFQPWNDSVDDVLADVGVTLGFLSDNGRLSAFVDVGTNFMENYNNTNASVGFRFGW